MIEDRTEKLILEKLISNENYARFVMPFLKNEYFEENTATIFDTVYEFYEKYNSKPSKKNIGIELTKKNIGPGEKDALSSILTEISDDDTSEKDNLNWLKDTTEKWCQERAITNAIFDSIAIIDGKSKDLKKDAIPSIVQDALSVSFNRDIGHDYIEDFEARFDYYHSDVERIPFDIDILNRITRGGLPRKTLSAVAAGTGVGKSIFLCHASAGYISSGKNVLFISLEMSEESVAERIDANLLDIPVNDLSAVSKDNFTTKINNLKKKSLGKLIIKQYPTSSAHVGHMRALLDELKMKKDFVPEVIIVDYLNICASSRVKYSSGANSYTVVKAIAEELRSLAIEYDVPVLTATQLNRGGNESDAEVDITNTSESFGTPMTLDFYFALIENEQLIAENKIIAKQLKNRLNNKTEDSKFVLGLDKSRMRFFDVDVDISSREKPRGDIAVKSYNEVREKGKNTDFSEFNV